MTEVAPDAVDGPALWSTISDDEAHTQFHASVPVDSRADVEARFVWAADNLASPAIESIHVIDGHAVFAFESVSGTPANRPEHRFEPDVTMRLLGECARRLHDTPVADCPSGPPMAERAEAMVELMVDDDRSLDIPYHRVTRQRLAEVVLEGVPDQPADAVVCHGHLDMAHILIAEGRTTTLAPPLGLTVADRHLDLATLVRSLSQAGPGELIAATMESYGWDGVAAPRMDWFDMLVTLEGLSRTDAANDSAANDNAASPPDSP